MFAEQFRTADEITEVLLEVCSYESDHDAYMR